MQSSTGQYSTQAGEPAQPVQHSVMTASSFGFFLRAVAMPFERGSCFSSSGTIPGAFTSVGGAIYGGLYLDLANCTVVREENRERSRRGRSSNCALNLIHALGDL